jgi:tetratricopeptide (TPR) repeat protein
MKRLFKAFVIFGVLVAGVVVGLRYLNSRRAIENQPGGPWTPAPPPMAEEALAPDEIVSVVDEPVTPEVSGELAGGVAGVETGATVETEPPPSVEDAPSDFEPDDGSTEATEEVEHGAAMTVEVLEPEAIPSDFDAERLTPDEEIQLAESEAVTEATEEVEHGAEMTVEVVEADEEIPFAQSATATPAEAVARDRDEGTLVALDEAPAAVTAPDELGPGGELREEMIAAHAADETAVPGAEPMALAPEDLLPVEPGEVSSTPAGAVLPAADTAPSETAAPAEFLTRASLELAATPETRATLPVETTPGPADAPVEASTAPEPANTPEASSASAPPETSPAATEKAEETSSADWIPAEEKAFEPLSAGVASPPDLALAETLEAAIGDLSPGAITPRPARNAESYLDEGNVYFNVGQYALAIERYTRAIELDDTLTAAHYNRANARTRAGEFDGALADYDRALELAPNDADALNNRGMLQLYRQNYPGALRDFNAALAEDPADTTVMVNRGLAHLHGGDPIRAVEDFREATSLDPGDAAAHYGAAQASAALGRRDDALRAIERALGIDAGYAREAAADPRLAILQGDEHFMRLLRESGTRSS